jgi:hypothetical protein
MNRTDFTREPNLRARGTRGRILAALAAAWSDCRYASRRYIELRMGPLHQG